MAGADGAFHEGERLTAEREGFLELPLGPSRHGQIVEADGFIQGVESSTPSPRLLGQLRRGGRFVCPLWYRPVLSHHGDAPNRRTTA
jgi:hypothetical protein